MQLNFKFRKPPGRRSHPVFQSSINFGRTHSKGAAMCLRLKRRWQSAPATAAGSSGTGAGASASGGCGCSATLGPRCRHRGLLPPKALLLRPTGYRAGVPCLRRSPHACLNRYFVACALYKSR